MLGGLQLYVDATTEGGRHVHQGIQRDAGDPSAQQIVDAGLGHTAMTRGF